MLLQNIDLFYSGYKLDRCSLIWFGASLACCAKFVYKLRMSAKFEEPEFESFPLVIDIAILSWILN